MDDFLHDLDDHLLSTDANHPFADAATHHLDSSSSLSFLGGDLGQGPEPSLDVFQELEQISSLLGLDEFGKMLGFIDAHLGSHTEDSHTSQALFSHISPADVVAEYEPIHLPEAIPGVINDPINDMHYWHLQTHDDTCAIVSQEFILDSLTGPRWSEDALRQDAIDHGWYTPGGGTPLEDVGNLLEEHGVAVERQTGATMQDLANSLEQGQRVIVAVNAEDIWNAANSANASLSSYPGIPGQAADRAVEVIGIDDRNPARPLVVLNDPGTPHGQGEEVPLAVFEEAWASSDDFMMSTAL